jgi:hypothetical protein
MTFKDAVFKLYTDDRFDDKEKFFVFAASIQAKFDVTTEQIYVEAVSQGLIEELQLNWD